MAARTMTQPALAAQPGWLVLAGAAALAIAAGALAAVVSFNPLILAAILFVAPVALWLLSDARRALVLLVAVVAVLPRFASPVSIGFKPTALDIALIGVLAAWVAHQFGRVRGFPLRRTAVSIPILLLVTVALATFIVGTPNGALTTLVLRRFAELVLSLLAVLALSSLLMPLAERERLVRATLLLGGLSATLGVVLYVMPDDLAIRLLSALRPFDYPTGPGVLRFIRDDPALSQRATGLWIDPNAFGGYLLMTAAFCLPQLFTGRPVLPRLLVFGSVGIMALCLVLTVSRGAMLGLAFAGLILAALRYRRLFLIGALVLAAALILPQARGLITHFIDGFLGADLATQMRFGEYKDAFRLIERYPLLGVGFTGSPDVDLYVGVSSMYLLIMQQMGLLGFSAFLLVVLALAAAAVRAWPRIRGDARRSAVFLGAHSAVAGMLLSGLFDHYFFNIDFHNSVMWVCVLLAACAASSADALSSRTEPVLQSNYAK
jgi:polysaccharide biosynthesis protein PslJ